MLQNYPALKELFPPDMFQQLQCLFKNAVSFVSFPGLNRERDERSRAGNERLICGAQRGPFQE